MGRNRYLAVLELLLGDLPEGVDLVALQLEVVRVRVGVRVRNTVRVRVGVRVGLGVG